MSFYEKLKSIVIESENHQLNIDIPAEKTEGYLRLEDEVKNVRLKITNIGKRLSIAEDSTNMTLVASEDQAPFITSRGGKIGKLEKGDLFLKTILGAAA